MEYKTYIARKRARFEAICGPVNIPFGTVLENQGGFLMRQGQQVCGVTSQNAFDHFVQNDDGQGRERGDLVSRITARLNKRDKRRQSRWNKIWADSLSQKYQRPLLEYQWICNFYFSNAPVEFLGHIAAIFGA